MQGVQVPWESGMEHRAIATASAGAIPTLRGASRSCPDRNCVDRAAGRGSAVPVSSILLPGPTWAAMGVILISEANVNVLLKCIAGGALTYRRS